MNYFELYDIAESFKIDGSLLKAKFYEFSKHYHPDFYVNEPEEKQSEILELSTRNNKAYQVLSDPLKRTEYILGLHGLMAEGDKYQLPPDFLMDMMDINEALMELESDPDAAKLTEIAGQVEKKMDDLDAELRILGEKFDIEASGKEEILYSIRDLWYRRKYLLRIKDSLGKFAT